ncbi:prepilin-type N-terminal cleavage/methylation domain-containing protein [Puniceicoccus vermicola]|uniref:Prepilin-type N-terminal cleavage/methylation domain-containing protein n=1 Tax=Puniceicoccus vermicola TaxID=388746 RepID=A0A7X1AZC0_9BACT|nr:prepilin-type N-terminal cleavage/methylation domain-containing protein [Puniceicoccus vermicola]MBC2602755.1 prepilin-type N-terminal cleavage/methylation domain-containing protein [Puniceicoccus vermicola]
MYSIRKSSAFSLVELLVGLAILAMLVGILIPVTRGAIGKARSAACASNLRQMGVAALAYASDNNGVIVPSRIKPGGGAHYWVGQLAPYLGAEDPWRGFTEDQNPYICPAIGEDDEGIGYTTFPISSGKSYYASYLINLHITARTESPNSGFSNTGTFRKCYMSQMVAPSRTMLFICGYGNMGVIYLSPGEGKFVKYPHGDKANILYLDGHVGQKTETEMIELSDNPHDVFWRGYDW